MDNKILTYSEGVGFYNKHFIETHYNLLEEDYYFQTFKKTHRGKTNNEECFRISRDKSKEKKYFINTSYYIGVDWIKKNKLAINVEPKLNDSDQIDYIKMLLTCIKHPQVTDHITELMIVKWDKPKIKIQKHKDLLTPFLILEFLGILRSIVKKGLKKSYYKVEHNLYGKIKGKVLISNTIKQNHLKNKNLHTYCSFEEFGVNSKENQLLKRTFEFCKKYLPKFNEVTNSKNLEDLYNFINPAFHQVDASIDIKELKTFRSNRFFKEYDEALKLAKLIMKRFGYNLSNIEEHKKGKTIETPPFWIDMSKLFEFYVLGMLKDKFQHEVIFQFEPNGSNQLDYLLKSKGHKMVIDAKYKLKYSKDNKEESDLRQISGYARLNKVYEELFEDKEYNKIIDGLVIYPDQGKRGVKDLSYSNLKSYKIEEYINMYKLGVELPIISN